MTFFSKLSLRTYYLFKPILPRALQIYMRRKRALRYRKSYRLTWPIDPRAAGKPAGWAGWPCGKKFALVLTHDVDTVHGQQKSLALMSLEKRLGFRSSFNFVALGYADRPELRNALTSDGFEVGLHGLRHRGLEYISAKTLRGSVNQMNKYLEDWRAVGFRSPCMYHNLEWINDLNIAYDASTFDTDPFEPQPEGVGTIFPLWMPGNGRVRGFVELPYTLVQDFTLFVLLREKSIDIWKRKLDWICEHEGMALVIAHPDYMSWDGNGPTGAEYPVAYYEEFLKHVERQFSGQYWNALPRDVADFWARNYGTSRLHAAESVKQLHAKCSNADPHT